MLEDKGILLKCMAKAQRIRNIHTTNTAIC